MKLIICLSVFELNFFAFCTKAVSFTNLKALWLFTASRFAQRETIAEAENNNSLDALPALCQAVKRYAIHLTKSIIFA